ncbi:hypothetical protein NBO_16g0006 [Nosema bombycis CQ1]|uniref:Uncharacterized protein n=1 Tax=Nosema bombycis (strain CQ1 / CVCC 102059) TaxID=578461 RepID=R0MKE5_NOSB1|nr:hypothetical protein NBO_16g0006 [Nosema bombycis CQ1]|eukprot:EOB14720.1 hypothetical protein NBO_16g0006 [Nosema bombycis CQ1]
MTPPLKYKPKNTNFEKIGQINIVSKYVSCSYGRFDNSYYVKDDYRFHNYRKDEKIITIILNNSILTIDNCNFDLGNIFYLSKFNTKVFKSLQHVIGELELRIRKEINFNPKDHFLNFVFNNTFTRSELIGLVDMFINIMGFKGILLKPYALAMCLGLGVQHGLFINVYEKHTTVFLVDDYWLIDSFTISKEKNIGFNCIDDEDFADEYHKIKFLQDSVYFLCNLCDFRHTSYSKALEHVRFTHVIQDKCECMVKFTEEQKRKKEKTPFNSLSNSLSDPSLPRLSDEHIATHISEYKNEHKDSILEVIKRLSLVYHNIDKLQKISLKVHLNDPKSLNNFAIEELIQKLSNLYGNVTLVVINENPFDLILRGMKVFNQLELAKECWLTDEEWRSVRLRILKEKVLFNL